MQHISDRIKAIRMYLKEKQEIFAIRLGVATTTLMNYESGKTDPGIEKIQKLTESFNELNAEWLLTGKGEMLLKKESESDKNKGTDYLILHFLLISNQILEILKEQIEIKNKLQSIVAEFEQYKKDFQAFHYIRKDESA